MGLVTLSSSDPRISVDIEQTQPALIPPPQPKIVTTDRPGAIGLTDWVGQDPYRLMIYARLDGAPNRSVERDIAALEGLAEVHAGKTEPPVVTVKGAIPLPHPNLKWRIAGFTEPVVMTRRGSQERCRYLTTVTLIQYVVDRTLATSLNPSTGSKGLQVRTHRIKPGEDLFDVARAEYRDVGRAQDIARANGLRIGAKLTPGRTLKIP